MNTVAISLHGTYATKQIDQVTRAIHSLRTMGVYIYANGRSDYYLDLKRLKVSRYGYGGGEQQVILKGIEARLVHRYRKFPPIPIFGALELRFDIVNEKAYVITGALHDNHGNHIRVYDPLNMRVIKTTNEYKEEPIVESISRYHPIDNSCLQYDTTYRSTKGDIALEKLSKYTEESLLPG